MRTIKHARKKQKYDKRSRRRKRATATSALGAPTRGQIQAIQRLFDQIPRAELEAALESSDDDRAARLLAILRDPAYEKQQGCGMAVMIRAAGLTVTETLKAITSMHRSDADLRVARRLPSIMERMALESEPHLVPCPRCSAGTAYDIADGVRDVLTGKGERCPRCRGKKMVMRSADNDVRKMVLESQNLLGSKGPLVDARQLHLYSGAPDMTDWSRQSDNAFERDIPKQLPPASEDSDADR